MGRTSVPFFGFPVSQSAALDCFRTIAGIVIGVPVRSPFRACDRYQAAWLSLNADSGNSVLTAAIISALVTVAFAAKASITASLMVRFCAAAALSGFGVFGVAAALLPMVCFFVFGCRFLFFMLFIVVLQNEWKGLIAASLLVRIVSWLVLNAQQKTECSLKLIGVLEAA
jgi:hypothetical protein